MSRKGISIALLVLMVVVTSCKKDDTVFDKEDALQLDTSLFLYRLTYTSHNALTLNFTVDMLTVNGLASETEYTGFAYDNTSSNPDVSLNVSNTSVFGHSTLPGYSTVIAFDRSERQAYDEDFVGFYLRRFFEIADSLPNRQVGLSSYSSSQNLETTFHSEQGSNIFGNSPEFSTEAFYNSLEGTGSSSSNITGLYFKDRVMGIIDTIAASSEAQGDLSITLVMGYANPNSGMADVDEMVAHALLNNVHINVICNWGTHDLTRLASETGGFYCSYLMDEQGLELEPPSDFSSTQTALQNLDLMLSQDVTTHRCNVSATYTSAAAWISGEVVDFPIIYNGHSIRISFKIP